MLSWRQLSLLERIRRLRYILPPLLVLLMVWFNAIKTLIYGRQILEETGRIFEQMDDEEAAQKIEAILQTVDEQFHPCETAIQVYGKLLGRPSPESRNGAAAH